ncbi:MAG: LamG domain-containing protein [Myxococcota bacterium]
MLATTTGCGADMPGAELGTLEQFRIVLTSITPDAHYELDGDATDASGNLHDGTIMGTPQPVPNRYGASHRALQFSGTDYIEVPHAQAPLTNPDGLTLAAWIRPDGSQITSMVCKGTGTNTDSMDYGFSRAASGELLFMADGIYQYSTGTVPANTWSHVAVTFDGAQTQFYINGLADGPPVATPIDLHVSDSPLTIGRQCQAGHYAAAQLDEVQIFGAPLTAGQVAELLAPAPDAHYELDGDATDASGHLHDGTINGSPQAVPNRYGASDRALQFSGTDYIEVPHADAPLTNPDGLTLAAWIRPDGSQITSMVCKGTGTSTDSMDYGFSRAASGKLLFMADGIYQYSTGTVPANTWSHVAVTFDGAQTQFYINGLPDGPPVATPVDLHVSDSPLTIGRQCQAGHYAAAQLDEVQIFGAPLTAGQVAELLAPAPAAHYELDGDAVDASGNLADGTFIGAPLATTDRYGASDKALYFPWGNYIEVPHADAPVTNPTGLTLATWIRPDGALLNAMICKGTGTSTATSDYGFVRLASGQLLFFADGIYLQSTGTVPANAWSHVAVTFDGAHTQFYIDGVADGPAVATPTQLYVSTDPLTIGRQCSTNNYASAKLDEVQIFNAPLSAGEVAELVGL